MAWDDSEFTSPDYSNYDNSRDAGGYDQIGQNNLQYNQMDTSNFWDNAPQQQGQQSWGMDNLQSVPPMNFDGGNSGQYLPQSYGMSQGNIPQQTQGSNLWDMFDKGLGTLNKGLNLSNNILGASQGSQNNTTQILKGLAGLWAAQQEKKAQGQLGQQNTAAAQQMQQATNPFSAERARYQQELASVQDRLNAFRTDPTANTQYKTLQDQLISQANRGSRQRGTSDVQMSAALAPQLTKAQMDVENQMISDRAGLYQPAGAGLNGSSGILEALLGANKATATADSNASYASVIGKLLQGDTNQTSQQYSDQQIADLKARLGLK